MEYGNGVNNGTNNITNNIPNSNMTNNTTNNIPNNQNPMGSGNGNYRSSNLTYKDYYAETSQQLSETHRADTQQNAGSAHNTGTTQTSGAVQGAGAPTRPDYRNMSFSTGAAVPEKKAKVGNGNGNNNNGNHKINKSFGRKLGQTAAIALVFGLVSGGTFAGINMGVDRLAGKDEAKLEALEEEQAEEQSFRDREEEKAKNDSQKENQASNDSVDTASTEDAADKSDDDINVQQIAQSSSTATLDYDVSDIVAKTQPSIVSITTTGTTTYQSYFQVYEQPTSGAGSGIIVGQNEDYLYVATNYHVIEEADDIKVGFNDGEVVDATVKGYDENADIALVLVPLKDMKDTTKDAITIASIGDSSSLKVGEPAIAIGNALGYGQSVTVGYISALNRSISGSDGQYIQTDAAINPGNSGGALINSKGEVIGVNSVKYVDSTVEGMGFSIPINEAMSIINDIASGQQAATKDLGIDGVDIGRDYAMIYGFPMGIYVKDIKDGSMAADSELHVGDIIVEFDGNEVYTNDSLEKMVKSCSEGETVELVVYRSNDFGKYEEKTISITI